MSNEFFTPQSRNEAILQNICGANNVLPEPQSRIEKLLQAILYEDETIVDFTPESRAELLLYAILTHGEYDAEPQSRNETILKAILTNGDYDALPQSRIEALLIEWLDQTHYEEKTVSGDVVSISDAVDAPVVDLTAAIVPVQSGSGDPSPTNIRPISGWTECKVTRAGKNLLNPAYKGSSMSSSGCTLTVEEDGTITINRASNHGYNSAFYLENRDYLKYFPSGIYAFSQEGFALPGTGADSIIQVTTRNKNSDEVTHRHYLNGSVSSVVFELSANDYIADVFVRIKSTDSPDNMNVKIQLERGSSVTSFEPYQGTTYPVTFGSAGTVYGGTLDVTTGTLTVTKAIGIFDGSNDEAWTAYPSFNGFSIEYRNMNKGMRQDGISNWLKKDTGTHGSFGMWLGVNNNLIYAIEVAGALETYDLASWKSYLSANPLQVVYPLATPLVYDLTPVEIRTLAGQNTIWADTGDVTVTYKAQRTAAALMMMAGRF